MAFTSASWLPAIFPRAAMFHPEHLSKGSPSVSGPELVVVNPGARWRARLSAPIVTENSVLSWRAFIAGMGGKAGTVLVPKFEHYGPRDANGKRLNELASAPYGGVEGLFDDDGLNFDLSGWQQDDSTVYATLNADAAINSTEIVVDYAEGIDGIRPGQYFGIGNRLYLAHSVWQEDVGDPTHIRFTPWLRAAASEGDTVIIDKPVCLMRFAQDATGELELDFGRWASGSLDLTEVF